jgi:hypothetical protein
MAEAIPPPHVPLTPDSSSLLDVPRPGAPVPFSHPCLLHSSFCLVFCCITFLSVSVFFWVFFLQFLPIFSAPVSLPSVHCWASFAPPLRRASTVFFFVRGQRTRDRFLFLYSFLLVFSYVAFIFPVFHCYLLVIKL